MRQIIPLLVIFFFSATYPLLGQQILITEFMAAPLSGEAEWVELMNHSSEAVNLQHWSLQDAAASAVSISAEELYLQPGAIIVVSDKSPLGTRWRIPARQLILLTALPALNNSGDDIILRTPDGTVADQLTYTSGWLGSSGVSVERRRLDRGAEAENWGPCIADSAATPGMRNSLGPLDFDLALTAVVVAGDSLAVTIENTGFLLPDNASLEIWQLHRSPHSPDLLAKERFSPPPAGSSSVLHTRISYTESGLVSLMLLLLCPQDQSASNDSLFVEMSISPPPNSVICNEIMFDPLAGSTEWLEYINTGTSAVNFSGFRIAGAAAASGLRSEFTVGDNLPLLPPRGYAVIASDSSVLNHFPELGDKEAERILIVCERSSLGLGNSGDEVLLLDHDGRVVDSCSYMADWHHPFLASTKGISLELLNTSLRPQGADAWSSCTEPPGGTPGRRNSIALNDVTSNGPNAPQLQVSPLPFSPDGDGHEDFCSISCKAPPGIYQARLRIYDVNGRLQRSLVNNAPAGQLMTVIWDGLDDTGRRARIGPYILLLEMLDTNSNVVFAEKGIAVVATRL